MKKVIVNISEATYEKLRFEAIFEKKSIQELISDRIVNSPWNDEVLKAFDEFMKTQIDKIISE